MTKRFVPLRIISGYSFLESGLTIEKIIAGVIKNDYFGAGIADFGVLYGAPSFYHALKDINRPSIIGVSFDFDDSYVCYVKNEEGYINLVKMVTLYSENKLDFDTFKNHLKGLIVVLETNYGRFKSLDLSNPDDHYMHLLAKISSLSEAFYLGLEITSKNEFARANQIREFVSKYPYDLLAFPRIRYQNKNDAIILDIVEAINNDEKIEIKEKEGQSYFQDVENYKKLYTPNELEETCKIIESVSFDLLKKRGEMMIYPVNNPEQTLKDNCFLGLKNKGIDDKKHIERLQNELDVIIELGYASYFLIVSDFIAFAHQKDILVGPGRGSAAGSLVSYALNITEVDPLDYDLQFERFLNKARKTMPDIDVDLMDTRREEVVSYMREKYGYENIANITTFQTIQAKQALRDIGRIYNIPSHHIDMLSKSITDKLSLKDAYKKLETFRTLVDSDKYFLNIVSLASKIENLPRQSGIHPAGIILNNAPLKNVLPSSVDIENHYVSQYEKDYLEEQGFLKIDFLSLRTLTTIDECLKLIKYNQNIDLKFYDIPYNDTNIYKLINSQMTCGIFQIESSGMKNAIKILHVDEFNDIVSLLALFRPGPLDNIRDFAKRKKGEIKVKYISKDIEKILSPTYGVLVYQEQISQIAVDMANYSLSEADLFRRAVSHKEKNILEANKKEFISRSVKNHYSQKQAEDMFNDILKFANYGFNKSHAVVYAITAARMAYLKYYYPLEFYVALLSTSSGANDVKFGEYVSELRRRNLKLYAPDINLSNFNFYIKEDGLLFPFNFIKGISVIQASKIIDERNLNGNFKDFFDFVKRMYKEKFSESIILKLIDAGCFDSLYKSRSTLRKTLKYALQFAELSYGDNGQIILDDTLEGQKQYFIEKDDPQENLSLEYESLGIMLSDNPLRYKKDLIRNINSVNLVDIKEKNGFLTTCGIISYVKKIKTKKNSSTMAFVKIFDEEGEIEVTIFPKVFNEKYQIIEKNNIVVVKGRVEHNDEKTSLIAEEISLLEEI